MDEFVTQKNALIAMIDAGKLDDARAILNGLRLLWESNGYGYKIREIERRISSHEDLREELVRKGWYLNSPIHV